MQEIWVRPLGWEDPLEKWMATHSNILSGKIPRTEEPHRLQSKGSQRVRHYWAHTRTCTHPRQNLRHQLRVVVPWPGYSDHTNTSAFITKSLLLLPLSWPLSPAGEVGRAPAAQTSSREDKDVEMFLFPPSPMPWPCELFPAKQLTFQTHFLNLIKPFISDLLFGPCFPFHNTFFL